MTRFRITFRDRGGNVMQIFEAIAESSAAALTIALRAYPQYRKSAAAIKEMR